VCRETALPAKFAQTSRAALGREPERPAEFVGLEERPQRVTVIEPDVERLKRFIADAS
jgi:threonine synthase